MTVFVTLTSPFGQEGTFRAELLDKTMLPSVDVTYSVHCNFRGSRFPLEQEFTLGRELLDAVVSRVSHVDVASIVHSYTARIG